VVVDSVTCFGPQDCRVRVVPSSESPGPSQFSTPYVLWWHNDLCFRPPIFARAISCDLQMQRGTRIKTCRRLSANASDSHTWTHRRGVRSTTGSTIGAVCLYLHHTSWLDLLRQSLRLLARGFRQKDTLTTRRVPGLGPLLNWRIPQTVAWSAQLAHASQTQRGDDSRERGYLSTSIQPPLDMSRWPYHTPRSLCSEFSPVPDLLSVPIARNRT
jgi:hypothetical protein